MLISLHIISTLVSMLLWYSLFLLRRHEIIEKRIDGYLIVLCILLLFAAISGIFLNLRSFSPFHILSIVTLTTIPVSLYSLYQKRNSYKAFRGVFYNFLWLNLAFIGALLPLRTLWYRLWIEGLWLSIEVATQIVWIIWIIASIYVIYLVYQSIRNPDFFRRS